MARGENFERRTSNMERRSGAESGGGRSHKFAFLRISPRIFWGRQAKNSKFQHPSTREMTYEIPRSKGSARPKGRWSEGTPISDAGVHSVRMFGGTQFMRFNVKSSPAGCEHAGTDRRECWSAVPGTGVLPGWESTMMVASPRPGAVVHINSRLSAYVRLFFGGLEPGCGPRFRRDFRGTPPHTA